MFGAPPNCRPECVIHQDCPSNRACIRQRCEDPCIGACGFNAICSAQNHKPICACIDGHEGDPYAGCNLRQSEYISMLLLQFCIIIFVMLQDSYMYFNVVPFSSFKGYTEFVPSVIVCFIFRGFFNACINHFRYFLSFPLHQTFLALKLYDKYDSYCTFFICIHVVVFKFIFKFHFLPPLQL